MQRPIRSLLLAASLLVVLPLEAAEPNVFVFRASLMAILEDNGLYGDLSPVMPSPGIALSLPLLPFLRFEPGLDLYYTYYGYSDELARAVPVSEENRSSAVFGFMLSLPFDVSFRIAKVVGFHASFGASADLRLALLADGSADAKYEHERAMSYFWSSGRWFYPMAALGFNFPFAGRYFLGVDLRAWYPLYRHWTGEDLPAAENLRFALGLRLSASAR